MKATLRFWATTTLVVVLVTGSAHAEWAWKIPNLNPFSGRGSHPASVSKGRGGPSMLDRVGSGTKNAWNSTTRLLNPWSKAKPAPQSITGTNSIFAKNSSPQPPQKASGFLWPFAAEKQKTDEQPKTVSAWLAGERPE